MFGLFKKRQAEPQTSYTQRVLAAQLAQAHVDLTVGGVHSALVTVANLCERSALGATVTAPERFRSAVSPSFIGNVLRDLVLAGDSCHVIDVRNGKVSLRRLSNWTIESPVGASEDDWRYRATLPAPGGSKTVTTPSSGVVHVRIGSDPETPWLGRSPLFASKAFDVATKRLEAYLAYELSTPVGKLIPVPPSQSAYETADGESVDPLSALKEKLEALRGGIATPETMLNTGDGRSGAPARDWVPQRLGPETPQDFKDILAEVSRAVYAACGVPAGMFVSTSAGSAREGMRAFINATLKPMTAVVVAELTAKLEGTFSVDYDALATGDIAAKARAFKAIMDTTVGVSFESAAKAVGLNLELERST